VRKFEKRRGEAGQPSERYYDEKTWCGEPPKVQTSGQGYTERKTTPGRNMFHRGYLRSQSHKKQVMAQQEKTDWLESF